MMVTVEILVSENVRKRFDRIVRDALEQGAVPESRRTKEFSWLLKSALLRGLRALENDHAAGALY